MSPKRRLFQLGLGRPGSRRTVDWEIEHHLAEQTDILVGEGWDPEAAREEAERRFGSLPRHRRPTKRHPVRSIFGSGSPLSWEW